jgi:hypothetical protein
LPTHAGSDALVVPQTAREVTDELRIVLGCLHFDTLEAAHFEALPMYAHRFPLRFRHP